MRPYAIAHSTATIEYALCAPGAHTVNTTFCICLYLLKIAKKQQKNANCNRNQMRGRWNGITFRIHITSSPELCLAEHGHIYVCASDMRLLPCVLMALHEALGRCPRCWCCGVCSSIVPTSVAGIPSRPLPLISLNCVHTKCKLYISHVFFRIFLYICSSASLLPSPCTRAHLCACVNVIVRAREWEK